MEEKRLSFSESHVVAFVCFLSYRQSADPIERAFAKFGKIALNLDDLRPTSDEWDAVWAKVLLSLLFFFVVFLQ